MLRKEMKIKINEMNSFLSHHTRQRRINVQITSIVNIHQRCFKIHIWLKMKAEPTYVYQRCFEI